MSATWGIIPAAGVGSRLHPLAFSKELLPVGSVRDGDALRPRAVSEYLVERMIRGGASRICFVISPGKSDIVEYYRDGSAAARIFYAVQPRPRGLCDAIFRALPLFTSDDDHVFVGLPDTVWFPADALALLGDDDLSFLCFPVDHPQLFDAIVIDDRAPVAPERRGRPDEQVHPVYRVTEIEVKRANTKSHWIWGALKIRVRALRELSGLWRDRARRDEYVGTLVNAWIAGGGRATASLTGRAYVDTGTVHGYHEALQLLDAVVKLDGFQVTTPPAPWKERHRDA